MELTRRLRTLWSATRRGKFRFARQIIRNTFWGMTHRLCRQCYAQKGLTLSSRCERCKFENLYKAIFDEE